METLLLYIFSFCNNCLLIIFIVNCLKKQIEEKKSYFLYTIVDKLLNNNILYGCISMTAENDYVERLEKIIDKQDDLLSQLDARFKQQDSLVEILSKENTFLKKDIQKHKELTRDMNKTVTQQKNVLGKLKKELEDQLKIQQDLHKEYGEVIKQLTDDLEEEQNKNEELTNEHETLKSKTSLLESEIKKLESDLSQSTENNDSQDNQQDENNSPKTQNKDCCPNCGSEIKEGYVFCESCGTKL